MELTWCWRFKLTLRQKLVEKNWGQCQGKYAKSAPNGENLSLTTVLVLLLFFFRFSLADLFVSLARPSDVLALPIFKQEDSSLPPENETKNPPFQYVLCTATSPAVKLHDETLTYLNQGET